MKQYQKISIFVLRIALGGLFLYSGLDKLLDEEVFSASGFLLHASTGPFAEMYAELAGNAVVDFLVVWGEILIGAAIIFGAFTRFASAMGILMMILFYLAVLPPEHGYISQHIIYSLVFVIFITLGAGKYFGVDQYLLKQPLVKDSKVFKFFLS